MSQATQPPPVQSGLMPEGLMTFSEHLAELRNRLIQSFVTVLVTSTVAFFYATPMIQLLERLVPQDTTFVQLSPGEVFLSSFKLSMFVGIGFALPVVLYHLFRFITPGLKPREKRIMIPTLLLSFMLFMAGVAFGYVFILPVMLNFLLDYGQEVALNQLSIAYFLNFCTGFLFASGIVFQLPIFLLLTSFTGLVTSKQLLQYWKYATVVNFILAAIITPSADPFSQVIMAGCLMGLYFFSVLLIKLFKR